ncbi:hypothetical protein SESBI_11381 [Sesbania bispinosa]|nr:hypothetical protein SESBI_11381 [Sesbania bispinosa]
MGGGSNPFSDHIQSLIPIPSTQRSRDHSSHYSPPQSNSCALQLPPSTHTPSYSPFLE